MSQEFEYPYCSTCRENFPMRGEDYDTLEMSGDTFYCPKGHLLHVSRESVVTNLRYSRRLNDGRRDIINRFDKRESCYKGVQTRQKNRLVKGLCPYCGKCPMNLAKHIEDRHGRESGR